MGRLRALRFLTPALFALWLPACSSPTRESDPGTLAVSGTIANSSGEATLVSFQCELDGDTMTSSLPSSGPARAEASFLAMRNATGRGGHRLLIRVLEQTLAPTTYRFTNMKIDHWVEVGWGTPRYDASARLPDLTVEVGTGGAAVWDFSI